jgi:hypothetical protein
MNVLIFKPEQTAVHFTLILNVTDLLLSILNIAYNYIQCSALCLNSALCFRAVFSSSHDTYYSKEMLLLPGFGMGPIL